MNTAVETKRALLSPKADVAIVLAVCALAGAAVALIQHVHFLLAPLALALLAGAIVALAYLDSPDCWRWFPSCWLFRCCSVLTKLLRFLWNTTLR